MAGLSEESLLQAIKKDDIKAYNALGEKARCGAVRLGRFPALSLMYLYNSRVLIANYEQKFLKITDFEALPEPAEISKKFSSKAGKTLRLYFEQTVSPQEMLLILDKTNRLKRIYPLAKPSAAVKERLKRIYGIKYSLNVRYEGDAIILDRRPLTYGEKKKILTACACAALAAAVAVAVPVTAVSLMPPAGEVTKLSQIKFSSNKVYTLKRDIVLPDNYSVANMNCTIVGGGNKLIFGSGARIAEFNGNLSDVVIQSSSAAVITSVNEGAVIENVTVNVTADVTATAATSLFAVTNYGTVDGVTLNVSGSICAEAASGEITSETTFGGLVRHNGYKNGFSFGVIQNCTVNFTDFSLSGEAGANAVFGGIAGVNDGLVAGCTVCGEITSDTFDLAGVCSVNNGKLSAVTNTAKLSQTAAGPDWNPVTAGLVLTNNSIVEYCENSGEISCVSAYKNEGNISVTAAGIACLNYSGIGWCINSGAVYASGGGTANAGGICARSRSRIIYCLSSGDITVISNEVFAGGISGFFDVAFSYNYALVYFGTAEYCISESKITVAAQGNSYAGGIVGGVSEAGYGETYYGGTVTNCYYTGAYASEGEYFGNIVGACGANLYDSNGYENNGVAYVNFADNFYVENFFTAFGAAVDENEIPSTVEDKGATAVSIAEILSDETYLAILSALGK